MAECLLVIAQFAARALGCVLAVDGMTVHTAALRTNTVESDCASTVPDHINRV